VPRPAGDLRATETSVPRHHPELIEPENKNKNHREGKFFNKLLKDLIPYYHAADLLVLASIARSEAFGVVQLEAMACGKPVVNTSLPSGVPYVSLDGITGITVPPANPEALAKAINLLLDDPIRRAQYGNAAWRRVQAEFNLELMTRRTLQLYQNVMQFPNRGATFPGRGPADFNLNSRVDESALANTAWPSAAD
jgi:glycosyltransferase involved in cell wall biosynthesis